MLDRVISAHPGLSNLNGSSSSSKIEWSSFEFEFQTTHASEKLTDLSGSRVKIKLQSSKIWFCLLYLWQNLKRKPIFLFDIMRNLLKVVFVKPRFCMRVFIVKNEITKTACSIWRWICKKPCSLKRRSTVLFYS